MQNKYACSASLTFNFKTVHDLFDKVKRDAVALEHEVTSDRFYNFVITYYSLIDWVRNVQLSRKPQKETRT
jgi:hypothetical protein